MTFKATRERFFQALEKLEPDTVKVVKAAYDLAEKEHEGQSRKEHKTRPGDLDPYLIHPLRVSLIVMSELSLADVTAVTSAVLHDVVEDGNSRPTIDDIRLQFGDAIAEAVDYLTKPEAVEGEKHTPESLLPYHQSFFTAPLHVRLVKLSDRLDNLRESLLVERPQFQKRYLWETREVYLPLAKHTSTFFAENYEELCFRLESLINQQAASSQS